MEDGGGSTSSGGLSLVTSLRRFIRWTTDTQIRSIRGEYYDLADADYDSKLILLSSQIATLFRSS